MQHASSRLGMAVSCETQNTLQAGAALGQVLSHVPEPKESHTKPQPPLQIPGLEQPVERETEVINLGVATFQPKRAVGWTQFRIPLFGNNQAISRMRFSHR